MPAVRRISRPGFTAGDFRRVDAPDPIARVPGAEFPNHLWSTVCRTDEEVEWTWTHTPEGSFVSGFRRIPR